LVVLKDSLRALAACHEVGLAHGDIKPENVILTLAGRVRLVDFGLWTSNSRRLLARLTPFYLAPEQWSGRPATPAGDVYAAMVMFFECLVGAPPFYADGEAELSAKHEQSTLPVDVVPEPVRELVLYGLAKDPRSRPEARNLLAHVGDVAAHAVGSNWERRGRRELTALLAGRSALPDVSAPGRRSGDANCQRRKSVRLAAVMGGALALAAGLASPPLAVILPSGSVFGSGEKSPVLAFPEPDRDAAPVRVVTNGGQLADRALTPAAKAGTAGSVTRARPPAPLIPTPNTQTVPYEHATPDAPGQGSSHPDSAAQSQSTSDQSTSVSPACTQELMSVHKPCTTASPEQPTPGSAGSTSDPSQVSIPVSMPVELPVPVEVPVQLPVPVQEPEPELIPIRKKIPPHKDHHSTKDTQVQAHSQEWEKKVPAGWQGTTTEIDSPTNQAYEDEDSGDSGP
jgi:serine/threonine-protein kinase